MHRWYYLLVTWMRWNCSAVPPHPTYQQVVSSVHYTTSCKHSLVVLRMGEIIARNMLSWLELLINVIVASSWLSMLFVSMMHGQANIKPCYCFLHHSQYGDYLPKQNQPNSILSRVAGHFLRNVNYFLKYSLANFRPHEFNLNFKSHNTNQQL